VTTDLQIAALRRINRGAELWDEGGQPLVYLPTMKVQHNGGTTTVDGLLCPRSHGSYTTRLFLSQSFPNRGQNWTVHQIMVGPGTRCPTTMCRRRCPGRRSSPFTWGS
jgi:hypothetical protein